MINWQKLKPYYQKKISFRLRNQVRGFHVEPKILEFVAKIIHETRNNKSLYLGGSPRASLAIVNAAKALAAIKGRDFVTPDDIVWVAPPY